MDSFRLRLHDDGSLTDNDAARLLENWPQATLIRRSTIDEEIEERLTQHAACLRLRRLHPILMKLLDITLLATSPIVRIVDSDILFLRRFTGLMDLPRGADLLFATDSQSAYSLRSWHLLTHGIPTPMAMVNTGVVIARPRVLDLDLIDHFLRRWRGLAPMWLEQTSWALLSGQNPTRFFDPGQVSLFDPAVGIPPGIVALHFASPVRGHLMAMVDRLATAPDHSTVELKTVNGRRLTALELARSEARRVLIRFAATPLTRRPTS